LNRSLLITGAISGPGAQKPVVRMRTLLWSEEFTRLKTASDPDGRLIQAKVIKEMLGDWIDMHRVLTEFGMGTSLRRGDYTEAAKRALQDALWHNSINMAELFGFPKEAMIIKVEIGVQDPSAVDADVLTAVFPYGQPSIHISQGGLDIPRPDGQGNPTLIANAAISVSFDMERTQ